MSEIVSQKEIQKLHLSVPSEPGSHDAQDGSSMKKIENYEFDRPYSFTRNQRINLTDLHEKFTRETGALFSEMMNTSSALHVASVNEIFYEEFIRSVPDPCSLTIIEMAPYPDPLLIKIDLLLVHSIIDFLTGGNGQFEKKRPVITECELILLKQVLDKTLLPLRMMWQTRIDVHPRLKKIETNPGLVKIVPSDTMVLIVTIDSCIGDARGFLNICYPASFIKAGYETEKQVGEGDKNNYTVKNVKNLMYKEFSQFTIDNSSLRRLTECKGKIDVVVPKDFKSIQKYVPVIRKEEEKVDAPTAEVS
ncbi:MAG: hypothetical protein JXJ04_25275 [Spirochaetales bacterium]|nr:hypothetical protein [Spirochaetales bacterium]